MEEKELKLNSFYLRYKNRRINRDNQLAAAIKPVILSIYNSTANNANKGLRSIPSSKRIEAALARSMRAPLTSLTLDSIYYGLKDSEEAFGRDLPVTVQKEVTRETLQQLGIGNVTATIVNNGMKQVKTVSKDIIGSLNNIFKESTLANESVQNLTKRIRDRAAIDATWKAKRIAQTETTRAWSAGSHEGYKASGVVSKRGWLANPYGTHPRDWHVSYSGTEVNMNESFNLDGESMDYPGDMNASPRNTVNCHCGTYPVVGKVASRSLLKPLSRVT